MHQINDAIERLRALTQVKVQNGWRWCAQDLPVAVGTQSQGWNDWSTVALNTKEYIIWSAGQQVMWLGQRFVVPQDLQGYPLTGFALRLLLTWWAQSAQIFVNGQLVQEGDLFDSSARVLLHWAVVPGEEIAVALRLVSPGHDVGALMRSRIVYEAATDDRIDPGFVADELDVLQRYQQAFAPEQLDILVAAVSEIDWEALADGQKFERFSSGQLPFTGSVRFAQSLSKLRQNLNSLSDTQHTVTLPKNCRIQMLGHAHLDLAWLWTVSETWKVAQRTFESVLALQQEFPDLIYCHSTPALYAWIELHRPDLFTAIQQQVAAGRWEIVGGMWVEPDLNLIDGESIIRQVLYAQRYVQEKFGELTRVAWVPDSFGFCWQLPQILKQGGVEYFVTQKLHWNDTTKFPYGVFWWGSPDGSQIFSLMSPPSTDGVMDTNPLKMASYAIDWETQTNLKDAFWLPGVGDHGGGPTRDMLEVSQRWQQSPFFPRLKFTTARAFLRTLRQEGEQERGAAGEICLPTPQLNQSPPHPLTPSPPHPLAFPVWNDELYLEFHRGCYTTHADQKRWNRRCEGLLYQAELFASLATLITGSAYPKIQLEEAWKKVLFNQFHDILPGTSISEVFVEANLAWQKVEQVGLEILAESLKAIASQIALPSPPQPDAQPIIVFNPLNWKRSEVVTVSLPTSAGSKAVVRQGTSASWEIYDLSGQKILSQQSEASTLLFLAQDVPSVGYRVFWLCQEQQAKGNAKDSSLSPLASRLGLRTASLTPQPLEDFVLENEVLRVIVDPDTGDLSSVFDKIHQREVLSRPGNQLQAFQDMGQYWDAWNIDPNYAQYPLPPTQLKAIQWLEQGGLRSRLRVVRQLGQSQFCQDYVLSAGSPILKIATTVDWQERHVLVKAAFPLNLEANYATYEIPCGAIQRPTRPQTPAEQAKWEVPALRWADLGDEAYGVSLLNDSKYGYDSQPSQLRLTLLRSPCWPDPEADRGIHHFTYAFYPHSGNWQSASTVRRGYELNLPLQVLNSPCSGEERHTSLQPSGELLDLQAENLILIALKQSEEVSDRWIIRCYECHGESAELSLKSDLDFAIAHPVDVLEQPHETPEPLPNASSFTIAAWKIASFSGYKTLRQTKVR